MAGCSTGTVQSTTTTSLAAPTTTSLATPTTSTIAVPLTVPPGLAAFGTETVTVGGEQWLVAVADTPDERFQGLRRIADLGALDGMLFVWDSEVESSFTMRTVPIPLEIGFFDSSGELFDIVSMDPCGDRSDCPLYDTTSAFQYAIEKAAGGWSDIPDDALLLRQPN